MNKSPARTIKDVLIENEELHEDNDTLFNTNEDLIKEVRELRAKYDAKATQCYELLASVTDKEFRIAELERELQDAKWEANFSKRKVEGMRMARQSQYSRINELETELDDIKSMSMFEFGNLFCSDESLEKDGRAFARSLLGKPMTTEEDF